MTHARAQSRQPPHVTRARGLGLDGRPGHLQGRNARSELGRFFVFLFRMTLLGSVAIHTRFSGATGQATGTHTTPLARSPLIQARTSPPLAAPLRLAPCAADPVSPSRQLVEILRLPVDTPLSTELSLQVVNLQP